MASSNPGEPQESSLFHAGELEVQHRAGVSEGAQKVGRGIRDHFPDVAQTFIESTTLFFLGGVSPDEKVWASPIYGSARVTDDKRLVMEAGPSAFDPIDAALSPGAEIGLLAIDFATRRRLRVNGLLESRAARRLVMRPRQVYANCPKYIQLRALEAVAPKVAQDVLPPEIGTTLSPSQRDRIGGTDTFLIASIAGGHGADVSHRGGARGFVRAEDEKRVLWPDYSGNMMFNTLGNLQTDGRAGLLFLDFDTGDLLQLSGRAEVLWDDPRQTEFPGAKRLVELTVEQVVDRPAALPIRGGLIEPSPFNP